MENARNASQLLCGQPPGGWKNSLQTTSQFRKSGSRTNCLLKYVGPSTFKNRKQKVKIQNFKLLKHEQKELYGPWRSV